jgi:hypothetical protein
MTPGPSVGADDQTGSPGNALAIVLERYGGRFAGGNRDMSDPAQHHRSHPCGSGAEGVTHCRMPGAEWACPDRVDGAQVAGGGLSTIRSDCLVIGYRARYMNTAGIPQGVQETETGGLGNTPGRHEFATYPINRADIALEHDDRQAATRQHRGQRGPSYSTPDYGDFRFIDQRRAPSRLFMAQDTTDGRDDSRNGDHDE